MPILNLTDVMPFGKYKDEPINIIIQDDPGYLLWLMNNSNKIQFGNKIINELENLDNSNLTVGLNWKIPFGKFKNQKLIEIISEDPNYVNWLIENNKFKFSPNVLNSLNNLKTNSFIDLDNNMEYNLVTNNEDKKFNFRSEISFYFHWESVTNWRIDIKSKNNNNIFYHNPKALNLSLFGDAEYFIFLKLMKNFIDVIKNNSFKDKKIKSEKMIKIKNSYLNMLIEYDQNDNELKIKIFNINNINSNLKIMKMYGNKTISVPNNIEFIEFNLMSIRDFEVLYEIMRDFSFEIKTFLGNQINYKFTNDGLTEILENFGLKLRRLDIDINDRIDILNFIIHDRINFNFNKLLTYL